jgi:uncharacterized membrane protein
MPYLIALLLNWLPLWRRQNLWFGVTVPPGFSATPQAQAALKRYRLEIWVTANLAVSAMFVGTQYRHTALLPFALLGQMICAFVTFARIRGTIMPFAAQPSSVRSAGLTTTHEGLPGGLGSVLIPLGMLAATAAYLSANWLRLPERFPTHWTIDGTPNRWATRTWHGVFGPLIVCAIVSIFMIVMAEMIIHASPRGRGTGTEAWTARFRRANLLLMIAGVWGVSAMMCAIALLPLYSDAGRPAWMVAVLPFIVIGSIVPFVIQMVRLTRDTTSGSDGTPDRCWKFGLIYFNPDDPAIVVEKRFGLGYTINFGHRGVIWILGLAVLVFVLLRVLIA